MDKFYLSEINIYPIKSLGGISVQSAFMEDKGLQYDRRWMLVDEEGEFITQRKHFQLALLQAGITNNTLTISHKNAISESISFDLDAETAKPIPVKIWDDLTKGIEVSNAVSDWFSHFMNMKVKLVRMPIAEKRLVETPYAANNEVVSFADAYPTLIIGQSALDGLNEKLTEPILMDRFRPNFVFKGGTPHMEDQFDCFTIGEVEFKAVKPCSRCVLITIDQQTGLKGQEPLKTLATYRHLNHKIMFGQNLLHKGSGVICVGDELHIETWK